MSLKNTLFGIASTTALTLGALAVPVAPAHAADPQVCVTGPAATAQTQPWLDFARTTNPVWRIRTEFATLATGIAAELRKLTPATPEEQVNTVRQALNSKAGAWLDELYVAEEYTYDSAFNELYAGLVLSGLTPDAADDARQAFVTEAGPITESLLSEEFDAASEDYFGGVFDQLIFPVPSPIMVPSPDAVYGELAKTAQAVDQLRDLALKRVVYSGTAQTCTTTASLVVPAVKTVVGNASTVTVNATREGRASRGDFAVLVAGEQVATARDASSVTATVPADLAAGKHVLSVVFAPVDGSPVSTQSSVVTVAKATTKTVLKVAKAKPGKPVKATVRVTAAGTSLKAAGTVSIKVGDATITGKVKKGKATLVLGKLAAGSYRLKAAYAGNASFAKSASKPVKLVIKK